MHAWASYMGMVGKFAKNLESSLINKICKSTKLFVFVLFNTLSLRILREAFNKNNINKILWAAQTGNWKTLWNCIELHGSFTKLLWSQRSGTPSILLWLPSISMYRHFTWPPDSMKTWHNLSYHSSELRGVYVYIFKTSRL